MFIGSEQEYGVCIEAGFSSMHVVVFVCLLPFLLVSYGRGGNGDYLFHNVQDVFLLEDIEHAPTTPASSVVSGQHRLSLFFFCILLFL